MSETPLSNPIPALARGRSLREAAAETPIGPKGSGGMPRAASLRRGAKRRAGDQDCLKQVIIQMMYIICLICVVGVVSGFLVCAVIGRLLSTTDGQEEANSN